jgi:hypothetical protein
MAEIVLGFEIPNGRRVTIPLRHLAVTGQTQESGKTTTLEALISRSGLRAIAFITKRGEASFRTYRPIAPYFTERVDWQFVASILGASIQENLKFQRSWIMKLCRSNPGRPEKRNRRGEITQAATGWKEPKTLSDVRRNVEIALRSARGLSEGVYTELREYLDLVIPQIARLKYSTTLELAAGLNTMDLSGYETPMQMLVISSVLRWVYERETDVVVVIPEAWEFIPQGRNSPVRRDAEELIRKGAANRNFVWLDSQDMAGVEKMMLRQVGVWIFGVQREIRELKRTLETIPGLARRPRAEEIAQLGKGQFFVCFGDVMRKVYVQPEWINEEQARAIAMGEEDIASAARIRKVLDKGGDEVWKEKAEKLEAELRQAKFDLEAEQANVAMAHARIVTLERDVARLRTAVPGVEDFEIALAKELRAPPGPSINAGLNHKPGPAGGIIDALDHDGFDYDALVERLRADAAVLELLAARPRVEIAICRPRIELDESTLRGQIVKLISEGFFDQVITANAAFNELKARGVKCASPTVYDECDQLTTLGILRRHGTKYAKTAEAEIVRVRADDSARQGK